MKKYFVVSKTSIVLIVVYLLIVFLFALNPVDPYKRGAELYDFDNESIDAYVEINYIDKVDSSVVEVYYINIF